MWFIFRIIINNINCTLYNKYYLFYKYYILRWIISDLYFCEQIFKNIGVTEYSSVDRGYSGDELLEKYKYNIQKSWKGKKEKESSIKKISKSEIDDGANVYLENKLTLTNYVMVKNNVA